MPSSIMTSFSQQDFDDTPEEVEAARLRSLEIDTMLAQEAQRLTRHSAEELSVLLLGQSSAGKSTLQKQFQLMCSPESFEFERASWRGVIFLNVVRALRDIFEGLNVYNLDQASGTSSEGGFSHPNALNVPGSHLMNLRLRLAPLLSMEKDLIDRLGADYFTDAETGVKQVFVRRGWQYIQPVEREQTRAEAYAAQARAKLNATPKLRAPNSGNAPRPSEDDDDDDDDYSRRRASMEADETISDVSSIMHQLSDDIGRLWILPDTQGLLRRRKVQLSEAATFFLGQVARISSPEWSPTNDDILFARVRTVGMEVFNVTLPADLLGAAGVTSGTSRIKNKLIRSTTSAASIAQKEDERFKRWKIIDVGGAICQRSAWVPYFEGTDAIIYLAPVSAFDEYMDEPPHTNCIQESIRYFKTLVQEELLGGTQIILLLNKCDVLQRKLQSGIQVSKYVTSYAETGKPNEADAVIQFFTDHFTRVFESAEKEREAREEGRKDKRPARTLTILRSQVTDTVLTRELITRIVKRLSENKLKGALLGVTLERAGRS